MQFTVLRFPLGRAAKRRYWHDVHRAVRGRHTRLVFWQAGRVGGDGALEAAAVGAAQLLHQRAGQVQVERREGAAQPADASQMLCKYLLAMMCNNIERVMGVSVIAVGAG